MMHKSFQNAACGALAQVVCVCTQFVMRTVFIRELGAAFAGLDALMAHIVHVLSAAEMGLGTAVAYRLYAPLARGDALEAAQMTGLLRRGYRTVGCVILGGGLCAWPFVHRMMADAAFSPARIRAAFALCVLEEAVPYFFSYRRVLLFADQRGFLAARADIACRLITCAVCTAILVRTGDYLFFLFARLALSLAGHVSVFYLAARHYPFLGRPSVPATKIQRRRVRRDLCDLAAGTVSGRMTAEADGILISAMVSTVSAGIYSSYALVIRAGKGVFSSLAASLTGMLGSLYASGDRRKAEEAFSRMEFAFGAAGIAAGAAVYCGLTPLIRLWLGEGYTLGRDALFVCAMNTFLGIAREPLWRMASCCGLFVWDKWVSILGGAADVLVSVALGRRFSLTGILLGTTCTLALQTGLKTWLLYSRRLRLPARMALARWGKRALLAPLCMRTASILCSRIQTGWEIGDLAMHLATAVTVSALAVAAVFGRTKEFAACMALLRRHAGRAVCHKGYRRRDADGNGKKAAKRGPDRFSKPKQRKKAGA